MWFLGRFQSSTYFTEGVQLVIPKETIFSGAPKFSREGLMRIPEETYSIYDFQEGGGGVSTHPQLLLVTSAKSIVLISKIKYVALNVGSSIYFK